MLRLVTHSCSPLGVRGRIKYKLQLLPVILSLANFFLCKYPSYIFG